MLLKTETAQQIIVAELDKIAHEIQEVTKERERVENEIMVLNSSKRVLAEKLWTLLEELRTYEMLEERERRMLMRAWVERVVIRKQNNEIQAIATVRLFFSSSKRRERMGIEPTHRLLGGAQDLKSWEGTSPQPLPTELKD